LSATSLSSSRSGIPVWGACSRARALSSGRRRAHAHHSTVLNPHCRVLSLWRLPPPASRNQTYRHP
jgi:hypothetical protein